MLLNIPKNQLQIIKLRHLVTQVLVTATFADILFKKFFNIEN